MNTKLNNKIPKVKDCIKYIETCGWNLINYTNKYNAYLYWFKGLNNRTNAAGNNTICFSLTELRDAYKNGW
jgi:hypothetical protein